LGFFLTDGLFFFQNGYNSTSIAHRTRQASRRWVDRSSICRQRKMKLCHSPNSDCPRFLDFLEGLFCISFFFFCIILMVQKCMTHASRVKCSYISVLAWYKFFCFRGNYYQFILHRLGNHPLGSSWLKCMAQNSPAQEKISFDMQALLGVWNSALMSLACMGKFICGGN
jgi:hypothetical protein